jgi:hypothetical protein
MMAKRQKPATRPRKRRSGALTPAARSERTAASPTAFARAADAAAGPTQDGMRKALDAALAEQIRVLFSQLCNGLTTGLPKPDPKAATDRFATGLAAAREAYEIASKLIG